MFSLLKLELEVSEHKFYKKNTLLLKRKPILLPKRVENYLRIVQELENRRVDSYLAVYNIVYVIY